jgi:hypothetical protein
VYHPDWSIVVSEGTDLRGGTVSYTPNTAGENSLAKLKNEIAPTWIIYEIQLHQKAMV